MSGIAMNGVVLEKLRLACKLVEANCEVENQQMGLRFNFSDDTVIVARPNHVTSTVKFIATGFYTISKQQIAEANTFLAWANARICMGNLALEMDSLELRFYLDMSYEFAKNEADLSEITQRSLSYVLSTFRQHRPAFELIAVNEATFDQALQLVIRKHSLVLEDSFGKLLTIIKDLSSPRQRRVTDRVNSRITINRNEQLGLEQETTIRLDAKAGTVFMISVFAGLDSERMQNAVDKFNANSTRKQFGRASIDRKRQELILSGAFSVARDLTSRTDTELYDFLSDHFRSVEDVASLPAPAA